MGVSPGEVPSLVFPAWTFSPLLAHPPQAGVTVGGNQVVQASQTRPGRGPGFLKFSRKRPPLPLPPSSALLQEREEWLALGFNPSFPGLLLHPSPISFYWGWEGHSLCLTISFFKSFVLSALTKWASFVLSSHDSTLPAPLG